MTEDMPKRRGRPPKAQDVTPVQEGPRAYRAKTDFQAYGEAMEGEIIAMVRGDVRALSDGQARALMRMGYVVPA